MLSAMAAAEDRRVCLVRHGESQVTVDRIIGGHRSCSGLSDLGQVQAGRLRDRIVASGEFSGARLVSSHFVRARQTAEIIASAFESAAILEVSGLGEHDPGPICDGMSYDEFSRRYGEGPDWHDLHGELFPGGETAAAFQLRVGAAFRRLIETTDDSCLVIACHAGVVGALFRELLGLPRVGSFDLEVHNTSITEFRMGAEHRWKLVRHNDAAHLVGLAPATNPR